MRRKAELKRTTMYPAKVDAIEELMTVNGINQSDLAVLSGVSTSTISLVLCTGLISGNTARKLADGLGVESRNIAIYPRNRKTAEAVTPAADTEQVCIVNNNNDTTDDSKSKGGKLYMYNGVLQDGKRLIELVPEETILEALVAHLKLPVAEVRWM